MSRRLRKAISRLCLTLQVLTAAMAFGQVVCLAADGHIQIEMAHAGDCETETRRHHGEEADIVCSDHSCVDLELRQSAVCSPEHAMPASQGSIVTLLPPPNLPVSSFSAHPALAAAGPFHSQTPVQASVVLLI